MTEEQKDILIVKMLDAPDSLTDKELDMILHDEELKDLYEASVAVSGACCAQQKFDAEKEWRLFRHRILPKPSLRRRFMRVAAIFLGVIVVGGLIGKVIDYTLTRGYEKQVAVTTKPATPKNQEKTEVPHHIAYEEPTSTLKETTESVTPVIASASRKHFQTPQTEDEEEEIDVDEYLRQQQEEIEDAIIRQNAEIYVDEYYAMKEFISGMNDENRVITE